MSGPIVRKYGFPNFEKIFGERDLKHGAEPATPPASPPPAAPAKPDPAAGAAKDEPDRPKP